MGVWLFAEGLGGCVCVPGARVLALRRWLAGLARAIGCRAAGRRLRVLVSCVLQNGSAKRIDSHVSGLMAV